MEIFDSKLTYPLESRSVWVAGHNGAVGSATVRRLLREGCDLLTIGHSDLDLRNQIKVKNWIGDAVAFLLKHNSDLIPINIGSGQKLTVNQLAKTICRVVGYEGGLSFDLSKPDGVPRKLLDRTRMENLGWSAGVLLEEGLQKTYDWYLGNSTELTDHL